MITRTLTFLFIFGFFGQAAYSQIATTTPASRCGEGTLVLGATATSGTIKWYDVPFYGTAVATGGSFTTPSLSVTKTYYVDAVDAGNCSLNTNQARVQVIGTISASSIQAAIFYSSSTFCKSVAGAQDVTRTGTAGGTYSVSPSGLTLNTSTGAITPGSSTEGSYTVTYTVTAAEGCTENPASTNVTITTEPVAPGISYTGSPFCTTASSVTVAQTGATGGTYSASPSGLTVNPNSGTITPSSSLSGTYTITYFVPGAGGCAPMTTTTSASINTASVGGTATPAYSPISAGSGTTISLTGYNGTIQWQQSANGTDGWATVTGGSGGTTSTYTTPNLSATTYYRAIVTNGVCSSATSSTGTVVVSSISVAGTAGTAQNICYGFTANLTLTGYTGTIQWQTNATGSFVDINEATGASYTTPALSATTSYQAVVTNGVSAPATSNEVLITVIPTSVGGSINSTTICSGSTTDLVLSENVGTIQWQTNASGSWVNIGSATGSEYTTPALTATTSYKAIVTNTPCSSVESTVAVVTVDPASAGGTATANPSTICSGGATTITLSGYTGTIQWQTNGSGSFADIKGETAATYTTPALTATTSYRAVVTSGTCSSGNSTETAVTVVADPTLDQPANVSICKGGTTTLTTEASGGTGSYSYQWQYSTTSGGSYTNVADGTPTGISYSGNTNVSLVITGSGTESAQANYYKCALTTNTPTGAGCGAETAVITVTSVLDPSWTSYSLPTPTTLCIGSTVAFSVEITNGLGGTISWIRSGTSGGAGTTVTTGDAPPVGTWYYRPHYEPTGSGCNLADGTETMVSVDAQPIAAAAGVDQNQCNSGSFTLAGNAASVGEGTWTVESGTATITSLHSATSGITGVVAGTPAVLRWTIVNGTCSSYDEVTLTNDIAPTAATAGSDQNQCNSGSFTLAGNAASVGEGTWTVESGTATITSLHSETSGITGVTAGTPAVLRWTIVNGTCSSYDEVVITNSTLPTITTTGAVANVCYHEGGQTTTLAYTATTNTPTSYSIDWTGFADQGSTAFAFASGGGSLTGIVIPAATAAGDYSGTMTITNANGCTATQAVSVTVNPMITASVNIAADPSGAICAGTSVTFTATPTNGGTPAYQWEKDGINIEGQTGVTYSYTPSNTDKITVVLDSESFCILGLPATSNEITMTVNAIPGAPTATAAQSFCSGNSPTVASLTTLTGTNIKWYADETGGTAKETTDALVTATDYWASQTVSGCESSARVMVTVTVTTATTYYQDLDADSYGNPLVTQSVCTPPAGWVTNSGDCDDTNVGVHSTTAAPVITTSPIYAITTEISGTSTEADGTSVEIFIGVTSLGTTTVTSGSWTKTVLAGSTVGQIITAKATATGKCVSPASNGVTVEAV